MGKSQRTKGAQGERELKSYFLDELGLTLTRNLEQSRKGGYDCDLRNARDIIAVPFAIEFKRQETLKLNEWWGQAVAQAENANLLPALLYRQNRQSWTAVVPSKVAFYRPSSSEFWSKPSIALDSTCSMPLKPFCELCRELLFEEVKAA